MTQLALAGKIGHRAGAALGAVVMLSGCGGSDPVIPAGAAGLELPVEAAPASAQAAPLPTGDQAAAPGSRAPAVPRPEPTPAASAGKPAQTQPVDAAKPKPAKAGEAGKPGEPANAPAPAKPKEAESKAVTASAVALPALGTYSYALTGTSTFGPAAPTMSLTIVQGAATGQQFWTQDARRDDGSGIIEELTLHRQDDGIYLSAYRLDVSTGLAGLILEFAPKAPVLLAPDRAGPGQRWEFDLESADGCATAHTEGVVIADGQGGGKAVARHLRLTSVVTSTPLPACPPVAAERVQDIHHPMGLFLPSRSDSDLDGTLAGVPAAATSRAALDSGPAQQPARREAAH